MMKALNILIVEDEAIIAEAVKEMAEELGHHVIKVANNYTDAIDSLANISFDLALLDINLADPKGSGLDVAAIITAQYKIPFVFVTAYSDAKNLQMAKALNPHGYVLKPINKDRLFVALELANENVLNRKNFPKEEDSHELQGLFPDCFFVKDGMYFQKVSFEDVLFLKSEGNYTEIYTANKIHLIRSLLKDVDSRLPKNLFKRVHRSHIINFSKLTSISNTEIKIGTYNIPVGETFKKEIQEILNGMSIN